MGVVSWLELIEFFNIGGCVICCILNIVILFIKCDLVIFVYVICIRFKNYVNIYLFGCK